jgi:mannose-6-phosphate isomerase
MDVQKISTQMVEYPWGSPSVIQNLVGCHDPQKPLVGELWMGVHHNAPSFLIDDPCMLVEDFLKQNPRYLGEAEAFPFLLKGMAFKQPLALQVHPNGEQARDCYAREAYKRKSLDKSLWNYQDPNPKAEMLVALGACTVMCGFLPPKEIERNLEALLPIQYGKVFAGCAFEEDPVRSYLEVLYALSGNSLSALRVEYADQVRQLPSDSSAEFLTSKEIALQVINLYGEDPGLLAPFMMQVLHLEPGQAIYLEPGVMHAYVSGYGIELMTNSDNILRGGLTNKHCDTDELLQLLRTDSDAMNLVPEQREDTVIRYLTDTNEFVLEKYLHGRSLREEGRVSLLFCTDGHATLSNGDESLDFNQGECVLVGASLPESVLDVAGEVFSASYPKK